MKSILSRQDRSEAEQVERNKDIAAFSIHILTASGVAWAFLALMAATAHNWPMMFLWLGVALIVDGVDGPLARKYDVAGRLPRWDGDMLDLVVDFCTYVFVPAYAVAVSGLLPDSWGIAAGLAITVSSALYFADRGMKTEENYFLGFPGIWNAVAFYLILLWPPAWLTVAFVAALTVMTFMPIPFIHPLRVVKLRGFHFILLMVWAALALVAIANDMMPNGVVTGGLSLIGLYIIGGGLLEAGRNVKPAYLGKH